MNEWPSEIIKHPIGEQLFTLASFIYQNELAKEGNKTPRTPITRETLQQISEPSSYPPKLKPVSPNEALE